VKYDGKIMVILKHKKETS